MKKVFSILLCLITAFATHAQGLRIDSTRFYCNSNPTTFEQITDIIQTKDGGFFFTGVAAKPGGGILPSCPGSGRNPVMGKLDSLGNIEWIKSYCDSPTWAKTACQTPDGGYVTCGTRSLNGMIVSRCDAGGTVLWERYYGVNAGAIASHVIATPDSGFLLLGVAKDRDSDILVTYDYPPSAFPTADWVLLKLDSLGRKQWVRTLGTSGDDLSRTVLMCDDKNYYFIGATDSKDHDCADVAGHPGFAIYTIKLDSAGNVLWSKACGAGLIGDVLFDERDNSILVTGRTNGVFHEFSGLPTYGNDDLFLMKIDTAGNYKWGNIFGTPYFELDGATICKAPNGGYFVAGSYSYGSQITPSSLLISADSNGRLLDQHAVTGMMVGQLYKQAIFPYRNSYCLFSGAASMQFSEGTGQNCSTSASWGSRSLAFSTLSIVPLSVTEAPTSTAVFTLSPNPTRNSVEIRFEDAHSKGVLTATNAEGKLVFQQRVAAGKEQLNINTSLWPPGAYLVCWQQQSGKPSPCQKLIVQ